MERPRGLDGFANQSRVAHLATVVGGIIVCLVCYFGAVYLVYADVSILASEAEIAPQRIGGVAAGIGVWTYFGLAFVRGYGGPMLNTIPYPVFITLVTPFPARWALFGPDFVGLRDRFVGLLIVEPMVTALLVVVPGFGVYVTILALWAWRIDEETRREWMETHLTPRFYDAYADGD